MDEDYLQYGDIVHITSETNKLLNDKTFLIDYIDSISIRLINSVENHMRMKEKEDTINKEIDMYKQQIILNEREYFKNQTITKCNENITIEVQQNEVSILKDKLNSLTIQIEREKNDRLLDTIDTNNQSINDITVLMNNLKTQTTIVNKSNVRGYLGENYFLNLALHAFCDCSNFEIVEKSKTPHSGDFWLNFDKFTIIVDSKNYIDTPVPSRDKQKLKNDVSYNQHEHYQ
jgi:hypothetical protein